MLNDCNSLEALLQDYQDAVEDPQLQETLTQTESTMQLLEFLSSELTNAGDTLDSHFQETTERATHAIEVKLTQLGN